MVTGCPSEIRKSLYGSGGACWKTHYRQKLTVGTWAVMAVIYYIAMISHQGLIRIFPNKRLKRDCQRVAFPVPLSRGGYGCCV
ncbi:hypothetical protein BC354_19705 [Vibrio cholerae]|nr:hypothetical protein BC354_19705 [Vibrio cholerae]